MGRLRDYYRGGVSERAIAPSPITVTPGVLSSPPTLEQLLSEQIAERMASFTLADALGMPAVVRGVQLICSLIAQFTPVAYRGGLPVPDQPKFLREPFPAGFGTRYQFLYQTVYSQLAMTGSANTGGDAYWLIPERDELGNPRAAVVLDPAEVRIEWDAAQFMPVYTWRESVMTTEGPNANLVHLTIGRPPGALHGRSPLVAGLEELAVVDAAEQYALGFFYSSGIPSFVIKAKGDGSEAEAKRLKQQWLDAHPGPNPTPAVMFEGRTGALDFIFPPTDAQKAQLQETRAYGATIVARLLGIPAPMLHVESSGATITYVNAAGALDDFVRSTGQPVYMAPLESYLSTMVPRTQTVRFDTNELYRTDLTGRSNIYSTLIASGVMTAQEARSFEGWPTDGPVEFIPSLEPTPNLTPLGMEVPARV